MCVGDMVVVVVLVMTIVVVVVVVVVLLGYCPIPMLCKNRFPHGRSKVNDLRYI